MMIVITQILIVFGLLAVLAWIAYRNRTVPELKRILVGIPVTGALCLMGWGWFSLRKGSPIFSDGLLATGLQYYLGAMLTVLCIAIVVSAINFIKYGKFSDNDYFCWSAGGFFVYAIIEVVPSVLFALTAKTTALTGHLPPIALGDARFIAFTAAGSVQVLLTAALLRSAKTDSEMNGSRSATWLIVGLLVSPIVIYGLVHGAIGPP